MPKVKLPRKLRDLAKTANGGCGEAAWTLARHFFYGTGGVEKNEELERQWLEKGAELGDVNAQVNFGMMLDDEGDYEGARKWWELAAAQGNAIAMSNIAQLYSNGEGVEKNESTAAEWNLKAAMKGDREAQYEYGVFLGKEMDQPEDAMTWFLKAAAQGHAGSMTIIGGFYFHGRGVEQNKSTAREWWKKAAANGDDEAKEMLMNRFGDDDASVDRVTRHFARGDDPSVDREAEVKLPRNIRDLAKKANAGCGEAARTIAWHFFHGTDGVEKDTELHFRWLVKAAELGDAKAQCRIGSEYNQMSNYDAARKWFDKAAAQGNADAMNNLGALYYKGQGVEKNISTAAEWYLKAAMKGNSHAQYTYGALLDIDMNQHEDAMKWYLKAAAQGDANAMNYLALLYFNGKGVERNVSTAAEWFLKAASKGDREAQCNYGNILFEEMGQYEDAMKWYMKAAAQGHAEATHNIGTLYFRGDGVEQNKWTAREWWEKAAAYGCEEAKTNLLKCCPFETNVDCVPRDSARGEDHVMVGAPKDFFAEKRELLVEVMVLTGVNISDDAVERFVSGDAHDNYNAHLGLCFLHGTCGLEKNLRMAKEMFKVAEIYHPDDAAVAEELVKLRACVTCGKLDARLGCKLCRGVRYCDKRCQLRDWHRGTERRPPHRETCSRAVNGIFPPGYFKYLRGEVAKEREASKGDDSTIDDSTIDDSTTTRDCDERTNATRRCAASLRLR